MRYGEQDPHLGALSCRYSHPMQSIFQSQSLRRPHAVIIHRLLCTEVANPMLSYPILGTDKCLSLPHPFPLPPEAPSSAHLTTPRTSSSLFKVLEAKADVMPAFLDWTRDWGGTAPTESRSRLTPMG